VIISHVHKFLYIGVPKTGTHSVTRLLRRSYVGHSVGRYHGSRHDVPLDYTAWATVRNPYTRLASWWRALVRNKREGGHQPLPAGEQRPPCKTFEAFLAFMVQHQSGWDLEAGQCDQRQPQHVFTARQPCVRFVRLEHFDEDFAMLPFVVVVNEGCLGRANTSDTGDKPIKDYYTSEALTLAVEYGVTEECEALGYPVELEKA